MVELFRKLCRFCRLVLKRGVCGIELRLKRAEKFVRRDRDCIIAFAENRVCRHPLNPLGNNGALILLEGVIASLSVFGKHGDGHTVHGKHVVPKWAELFFRFAHVQKLHCLSFSLFCFLFLLSLRLFIVFRIVLRGSQLHLFELVAVCVDFPFDFRTRYRFHDGYNGNADDFPLFFVFCVVFDPVLLYDGLDRHLHFPAVFLKCVYKFLVVEARDKRLADTHPLNAIDIREIYVVLAAWRFLRYPTDDFFRVCTEEGSIFLARFRVYFDVKVVSVWLPRDPCAQNRNFLEL